jgi:DNA-binding CsgD family transcriptional regulator
MLTITGEIDGIELGRDSTAPSSRSSVPSVPPSRRRFSDGRPPDLWSVSRRRDAFDLICPASRGASAVVDVQKLKVYYANEQGRRLFALRHPFRVDSGILMVAAGAATERLRQALSAVPMGGSHLVILNDDISGAASIRVSPADLGDERLAGIAIADFSAERVALNPDELAALAKGFGLTEAEAAIAGLLVDGLSLEQVASIRGVQRETVRNQCKTLLAKMHCHRQVDLVRMALSLCARPAAAANFPPR